MARGKADAAVAEIKEADPNKSVVGVFLGVITGMIHELGL
jgi:hypothetical protein